MHTHFTPADIIRLERDVRALRRENPSLAHMRAFDLIAQREGWPNWALLKKNSIPPGPSECLKLVVEPFEPGDRGVFFVKLVIESPKLLAQMKQSDLSFELPAPPPRWVIRQFLKRSDPYLDRAPLAPRGRFVNGKFLCIVSANGVAPADVELEVAAQLQLVSAQIREAAIDALEALWHSSTPGLVRLFFSRPGNGIREIDERAYSSLAAARQAQLPVEYEPIGIPTKDGWWTYQAPFGWQPPAK
ncbi:hypothetical protein J2X20_005807 [Pelomonas saccharophila]|uniref:Uncharacterized protein n=1 Tax=Roseateles saccharophilus TaxID=304 RepID=A0ABU1YW89_ROSSA|nr:hypothetical protein [Roseateles saccharophilus]MDR7273122.1 hypothetical protein [Roseateles saccharophilus]